MAGITGRYPQYPGNYPASYAPTMNGYQNPGYGWPMQQAGMMQQAAPAAQMSKPTVHADIIQIENEDAADSEPVDAGTSQMMITKDEMVIMIKSVLANGETTMDIYRKQPKAPKPAEPEYVTRAEFDRWVEEMTRTEPARRQLRVLDPEEDETEYKAPRPAPRKRTATEGEKRG